MRGDCHRTTRLLCLAAALLWGPATMAEDLPVRVLLFSNRNPARIAHPPATVTYTANVSGYSLGAPTGFVTFQGDACGTVPLVSGAAYCTVPAPRESGTLVYALYSGDMSFPEASSAALVQESYFPDPPPESTGTLEAPGDSLAGEAVTVTQTISGNNGTPTGWVEFRDGGLTIAGCDSVPVAAVSPGTARAECTLASPRMGTHAISSGYFGSHFYSTRESWDRLYTDWTPQVLHTVHGSVNVALASAGATASASSDRGAPVSSIAAAIDGDRYATGWGSGAGWEDDTHDAYPDWVQVAFAGRRTIDTVVVYSLRDDYASPTGVLDGVTFADFGLVDFSVQAWNGGAWITLGTVTGNNLVQRIVMFEPFATDRIRVLVTGALQFNSRIVEIEAWGEPAGTHPTNVAHAAAGARATASSDYGPPFSRIAAVNDGERTGTAWGAGGGWQDATLDSYPDWVQLAFNAVRTIDRVVVYSLRDDYSHARVPWENGAAELRYYGLRDFRVEGWSGTGWVTLATVTGNVSERRVVAFAPFTTDRIRVVVLMALHFSSRIVEIEAWGVASEAVWSGNVASRDAGATATASSDYGAPFSSVSAVIDNDTTGASWGHGGGWEDATFGAYPDWIQVNFSGAKTIDRVVVYSLRDDYGRVREPDETTTFARYGLVDFTIEGWDGSAWTPLAAVSGNNLAKRSVTFPPFATDRIRVNVTHALYFKSRIVEIEAWGVPAPGAPSNVALASRGAVATASSDYGAPFSSLAAVNDGDFTGAAWGHGGGWEDGTFAAFPDWVQVRFDVPRTIDRVVVYSLRDNYGRVVAPTETTTFSLYGLTDFTVEGWSGTDWVTLGSVAGNDRVVRTVSFPLFATDRIRVLVTAAGYFKSRVVEIEAWGR